MYTHGRWSVHVDGCDNYYYLHMTKNTVQCSEIHPKSALLWIQEI